MARACSSTVALLVRLFGRGALATSTTTSPPATTTSRWPPAPLCPLPGCSKPQRLPVTNQRQTISVGGRPGGTSSTPPRPPRPAPRPAPAAAGRRCAHPEAARGRLPRPVRRRGHRFDDHHVRITRAEGRLRGRLPPGHRHPGRSGTPRPPPTPIPILESVTAMLTELEAAEPRIDTSRVYASGLSDGSFMVSLTGLHHVEPVRGGGHRVRTGTPKPCRPARRAPVIAFNGMACTHLFFNGGAGTGTSTGRWATRFVVVVDAKRDRRPGRGSGPTGRGSAATVKAWAIKDGRNPHATDTRTSSQIIRRTYRCRSTRCRVLHHHRRGPCVARQQVQPGDQLHHRLHHLPISTPRRDLGLLPALPALSTAADHGVDAGPAWLEPRWYCVIDAIDGLVHAGSMGGAPRGHRRLPGRPAP